MRFSLAISSTSTAAPSGSIRASSISPSASAADWASPLARRSMWCGWRRPAAASPWARDVNCIGDDSLERPLGVGLKIFVRVRSTRAPQPACLRAADGGYEVELVAGEEGVSPGQACVFYDAPSGQARVLGGGFIQSATASTIAKAALRPQPLVEAVRG